MLFKINEELVSNTIKNMHRPAKEERDEIIKTGFDSLDHLINGFGKGQLAVLGARPAMGKTAFACSVIENVCIKGKRNCLYISAEGAKESIIQRLIKIHGVEIKDGEVDFEKKTGFRDIAKAPLWIDDTPGANVKEICAKAGKISEEAGLDLIIVDYLQVLEADAIGMTSRLKEIGMILARLKNVAEKLNCAVLALSQVSRAAENRPNHFPAVSDISVDRYALDKYADIILLLYREAYYTCLSKNFDVVREKNATIHIERSSNRSGLRTTLAYDPEIAKFTNQ